MQPQPTSMMLSADAYRRELLADAARVQPARPNGAIGRTPLPRLRRSIGLALLRSGERVVSKGLSRPSIAPVPTRDGIRRGA